MRSHVFEPLSLSNDNQGCLFFLETSDSCSSTRKERIYFRLSDNHKVFFNVMAKRLVGQAVERTDGLEMAQGNFLHEEFLLRLILSNLTRLLRFFLFFSC